jgi:hypothetical protein
MGALLYGMIKESWNYRIKNGSKKESIPKNPQENRHDNWNISSCDGIDHNRILAIWPNK